MENPLNFWIGISLFSALVGVHVGRLRGRAEAGALLGLLFGPLGVIVAALLPPTADAEARFRLQVRRRMREIPSEDARAGEAARRSAENKKQKADELRRAEMETERARLQEAARVRQERERQRLERQAAKTAAQEERRRQAEIERQMVRVRCPHCAAELRALLDRRVACPHCKQSFRPVLRSEG